MLTFEKILTVFRDYLNKDERYEILITSRGYTVMEWDSVQKDWAGAQFCPTPEKMKNILLEAFTGYLEYQVFLGNAHMTPEDIKNEVQALSDIL